MPAVRQLQHSHDQGRRPEVVEVALTWIFDRGVLLGDQHDDAVLRQSLVDGEDALVATDGKRQDDVGKDHRVLQR